MRQREIKSLREQLENRRRNLQYLQKQATLYAAAEIPMDLRNKIEMEKSSIEKLDQEIRKCAEEVKSSNFTPLRKEYLDYIMQKYSLLDFRGILQVQKPVMLPLEKVYVPLSTIGETEKPKPGLRRAPQEKEPLEMVESLKRHELDKETKGRLSVNHALKISRRLAILGDPGSGKTTLLKYIALCLAQGKGKEKLGMAQELTPVLFPIRAYADAIRKEPDFSLAEYLPKFFMGQILSNLQPFFKDELENGRCLLLLDGLDEVLNPGERLQVVKSVEGFIDHYPDNRFVVTSRIAGYSSAPLTRDFLHLTILSFGESEIKTFASHWCIAYQVASGRVKQAEAEGRKEVESLVNAIFSHPNIERLATNPLLLTILALIHYQGTKLPDRRVKLYELCVQALSETWNLARSLTGRPIDLNLAGRQLDEDYVVNHLGPIALWLHETKPGGELERREIEEQLVSLLQTRDGLQKSPAQKIAHDFLDLIGEYSGLLQERGLGLYGFMHLTFEEYLSARTIIDIEEEPVGFITKRIDNPTWWEVIRLAVGASGRRMANLFTKSLLSAKVKERGRNIVLAGECLLDVGKAGIDGKLWQETIDALKRLTEDEKSSIRVRIDAGDVLGELGDPRLGDDVMQKIPAGEFMMGDKKPFRKVFIDTFYIDKYPVTNGQFEHFVESTGYKTEPEKREKGTTWRTYAGPRRRNRPVVMVSYNDACAYARWAGKRLPTEEEWEKSARGTDGRIYPWGDEFNKERCNILESEIGDTTPVGIFPSGASPYGVMDMAGNVWEWTDNWYDDKKKKYKVVRGGSWFNYQVNARCADRFWLFPGGRYSVVGFRCVGTLK